MSCSISVIFPWKKAAALHDGKLAYTTQGTLSAQKDNAILMPTWYSGTSKIMADVHVGKGRAIDPDKYFVIIANQLGNGLSSAPSNTPVPFNMARFPRIRIGDDVRAQHKLVTEQFGLERLETGVWRLHGRAADL